MINLKTLVSSISMETQPRSTRPNQSKIQNKNSGLSNARPEIETEIRNQRVSKIVDPCFKNVLRKELQQERLANKIKLKGKGMVHKANKPLNMLQVEGEKTHKRDGTQLEVDGLEELDYVDDVIDDELSDFEVEEVHEETGCLPSNMDIVDKSLPRGTVTSHMSATKSNRQTEQQVHLSTNAPQSATNKDKVAMVGVLSDKELANMPQVKNLFNKFWEEKMKEINKGETINSKQRKFVKSPSDTTIYAPALVKSPINNAGGQGGMTNALMNNKVVDSIVSDFVDSVRLEQCSEELQEKEWRKSSSTEEIPGLEEVKSCGDKAVIEAEKFRTEVAAPNPGTEQIPYESNINTFPNIGVGVSDDNFFHLTCHIDPTLIHKIEMENSLSWKNYCPKINWVVEMKKTIWNGFKGMVEHFWFRLKKTLK